MKKPRTKADIEAALNKANFRLGKKGIYKVTPAKEVKAPKGYAKRTAAAKQRRAAKALPVPEKYVKAVRSYGVAKVDKVISRRGRYYTAAGVYQIKKNGLAPQKSTTVQNVYSWDYSTRKGWYVAYVNGKPEKTLKRWDEINRAQKAAWRKEKIRAVAERTGLAQYQVREILTRIRKEETTRLKRFKATAKFKKLSAKEKARHTIAGRVTAIFGAMCDILEVYGSPKTKPD